MFIQDSTAVSIPLHSWEVVLELVRVICANIMVYSPWRSCALAPHQNHSSGTIQKEGTVPGIRGVWGLVAFVYGDREI